MAKRLMTAVGLSVLAGLLGPTAGSGPSPAPGDHVEVERVSLVLLPTTVLDRNGRTVHGLGPADFSILDEGTPREVELFATEVETSVAIAFLLDVSGSMRQGDRLGQSKRAIGTFVQALGPHDRFALIAFADDQTELITAFTTDRGRFLDRLAVQEALGPTALYDALAAAPRLVDDEIDGRKAIVLLTDGIENASRLPMLRAVWMARRVQVPIHTVFHVPYAEAVLPRRIRQAAEVLERFSEETGGRLYTVHQPADLTRAIAQIQDELKYQYLLGFRPSDSDGEDRFRRLQVRTLSKQHDVRTRSGYYP